MVSFQLVDVFTVGFQISLCSISNSRTMNTIDHLKLLSFITWCHLPRYFEPNLCCKINILSMNLLKSCCCESTLPSNELLNF